MARMVWILVAAVVLALAGTGVFLLTQPTKPASPGVVQVAGAEIGGPFALTTPTGARVTERDVITGPTLVYFGYTFCPDICPIDVALMLEATDLLAAKGIAVKPVFITIDPARDTPQALADYVAAIDPKLTALTGSAEDIKTAAEAYKVYYAPVGAPDSAAGYLMNHTAFTYLMLPDGIAALFRRGYPAADMAAEVARALAAR